MKRITSFIMAATMLFLNIHTASANEIPITDALEFSYNETLSVTDTEFDSMSITINGMNTHINKDDITLTAYSDKNNCTLDTLVAMKQTTTGEDGSFSFKIGIKESITDGIIKISSRSSGTISAEFSFPLLPSEYIEKLDRMNTEIKNVIFVAEAAGIPIDYEKSKATVFDTFTGFLKQDMEKGEYSRVFHHYNILKGAYAEIITNINAYLSGDMVPEYTTKYVTSKDRIDGLSVIANTKTGEKLQEKPVFFVGYGHMGYVENCLDYLGDMGINMIHSEIGPYNVLFHPDVAKSWEYLCGGYLNGNTDVSLSENAYLGTGAMKFVSETPDYESSYVGICQTIDVEPNTYYKFGAYIKGNDISNLSFITFGENGERIKFDGTKSEYTEVSGAYKTGPNETKATFKICAQGINSGFYADEIYVRKPGSKENLILNSGFEDGEGDKTGLVNGFKVKYDDINRVKSTLQKAQDNNIAVTLLLSPHYFPGFLSAKDGSVTAGATGAFMPMNPTHPTVKMTLETYLDILLPEIAGYTSLESIIIANEPSFNAGFSGTEDANPYYLPIWREYLKTKYTTIDKLNKKYSSSYGDFSEVDMPAWGNVENRDRKDKLAIDYIEFNNSIITEFHKYMAAKIRSIIPDIKLHSKIMDYMPVSDAVTSNKALTSGNSYEELAEIFDINGCDSSANFGDSDKDLKSQLMWYDYQRSVMDAPIFNTEDHLIANDDYEYREGVADWNYGAIWQGAIHGRAATTIWWWHRADSAINGDMRGALYTLRPAETLAVGKAALDLNRLSEEVTLLQNQPARVAILYSHMSNQWNNHYSNAMYKTYSSIIDSGERVDFVTDSAPEKLNSGDYKVLIAPLATNVSEETLNEIIKFKSNGGKVLLLSSSLAYNEYNEAHNSNLVSNAVSGCESINCWYRNSEFYANEYEVGSADSKIKSVIEASIDNKLLITEASTGKKITGAEVLFAEDDEGILVNIYNFDSQEKQVTISYNGIDILKSYDLISGKVNNETVAVSANIPVLLRIDESDIVKISLSRVQFSGEFDESGLGANVVEYNPRTIENGYYMASYHVPENLFDEDTDVRFVIAVYDGNRLKSCKLTEYKFTKDNTQGTLKSAVEIMDVMENTTLKAFAWTSEQKPLGQTVAIGGRI